MSPTSLKTTETISNLYTRTTWPDKPSWIFMDTSFKHLPEYTGPTLQRAAMKGWMGFANTSSDAMGTLPLHSGTPGPSRTQCWSNSFPGFLLYLTLIQWEKVSATARQCPGFCEAGPFIQWALMYRFQWNKSEILYCRRFVPHWKQILIRWLFRDCIGRNGVKMLTPFFPRLALNRHLGY